MSANRTLLSAANRYRELNRSQYWSDEEFRSYTNAHLDQRLRDAVSIRFDAERSGGGSPRAEDLKTPPAGVSRFAGDQSPVPGQQGRRGHCEHLALPAPGN